MMPTIVIIKLGMSALLALIGLNVLFAVFSSDELSYTTFIVSVYLTLLAVLGILQEVFPTLLEPIIASSAPFLTTYRGRGVLYIIAATLAFCPTFGMLCMVCAIGLLCGGVGYIVMSGKLEDLQQSQEPPVFFAPPPTAGSEISKPYTPPIGTGIP